MDWAKLVGVLAGGLGGGLLRLLPEAMGLANSYFKSKQDAADKAHELNVMKLQIEAQKQLAGQKLEEIQTQGAVDTVLAQIKGAIEVTKPTGNRFVDFLNGSVRPVITYWFFCIYAMVKSVGIYAATTGTSPMNAVAVAEALNKFWQPEDSATLFGILSFWFLGRVIDKRGGK